MSYAPRDIIEVVRGLDSPPLPFDPALIEPEDDRIVLHVGSSEVTAVVAYFDEHPIVLADGTREPVEVHGGAGGGVSEPRGGGTDAPAPMPLEDLIGLHARDAARRANKGGWLVRAYEPGAPITA